MNAPHIVAFGNGSFPILVKPCACALTRTLRYLYLCLKKLLFQIAASIPIATEVRKMP